MRRTPLLVLAGSVVGFVGALVAHSWSAPRAAPTRPAARSGVSGPSAAARSTATRSATGPEEQYGYGVLDVRVTARGDRISDVTVPILQTADPTSQQLASEALPVLRNEVLAAQSARIDAVSGATYTSEAYVTSLQAALDRLHLK